MESQNLYWTLTVNTKEVCWWPLKKTCSWLCHHLKGPFLISIVTVNICFSYYRTLHGLELFKRLLFWHILKLKSFCWLCHLYLKSMVTVTEIAILMNGKINQRSSRFGKHKLKWTLLLGAINWLGWILYWVEQNIIYDFEISQLHWD